MSMLLLGWMGCGLDPNAPGVVNPDDTAEEADVDTDADTDADTDTDTEPVLTGIDVDSLTPPYGSTAGGQEVTITGGPFDADVVVTFGDAVAGISSISETSLVVITPPVAEEGATTVTVVSGEDGGQLPEGFMFFANASGLAGSVGVWLWAELTGNYWGSSSYSDGFGGFLFIQPADFHWWQFSAPAMDSCANDATHVYDGPELFVYDLGVEGGVTDLTLRPQVGSDVTVSYDATSYYYQRDPLASTAYIDNGWYDLLPISGGLLAGMAVDNLFRAAGPMTVQQPAISGASVPYLDRSQTFLWTPGGYSWVEISLAIIDVSGKAVQESVTCVVQDDGEFTIDGSKFTAWPTGRQVNIGFTAVREGNTLLPHNDADSRVVGMYQMIGASFSR